VLRRRAGSPPPLPAVVRGPRAPARVPQRAGRRGAGRRWTRREPAVRHCWELSVRSWDGEPLCVSFAGRSRAPAGGSPPLLQ